MVSKVPRAPGDLSCASHLAVALDGHEQIRPGLNLPYSKEEGLFRLPYRVVGRGGSQ